jgi:hypothetical protein
MKFIVSSMSLGFFLAKDFLLEVHELTEDEFQAIAYDGISHIGHEDIAEITNFAYNKTPIQVRPGDIILVAQKYHGILRFHCLQVIEAQPLIREEELYIEEELI